MRQLDDMPPTTTSAAPSTPAPVKPAPTVEYRVLARKYRPSNFAELIGHDTLVRTLSNAFAGNRIAHAFMLTGVRGVGKTTTARIIARALNCTGPDGRGGPTMSPCGVCDACVAIAQDRHPDVMELDAASRTGIDDMREVIESVRYRPVSARYKIYIIDEVHMLSKAAFNALLKTLEEPPPDIKFIFATTEINKVPITVLSRCQRYTLPRIETQTLIRHYASIAAQEQVEIEAGALALLARAADGSVRDGLSILDQAIALGFGQIITEQAMRDMLGVADRGLVFDLFESVMAGDAALALARLETLYNGGTDPALVIQDLLDITHTVTRLKVDRSGETPGIDEGPLTRRAQGFAQRLGVAVLTRTWQMLLKGLAEVQSAPHPLKAAEMVLVRLVYVADLPPPADLLRSLQNGGGVSAGGAPAGGGPTGGGPRARLEMIGGGGAATARALPVTQPAAAPMPSDLPNPASFTEVVALIAKRREGILYAHVANHMRLVRFEPGQIEFAPDGDAPRDLSTRLGAFLTEATGRRWVISVSRAEGAPTLRQQAEIHARRQRAAAEAHPLVKAALAAFPGATITRVTDLAPPEDAPLPAELPAEPVAAVQAAVDDAAPDLYEEDDPGPFAVRRDAYEPDEEERDD